MTMIYDHFCCLSLSRLQGFHVLLFTFSSALTTLELSSRFSSSFSNFTLFYIISLEYYGWIVKYLVQEYFSFSFFFLVFICFCSVDDDVIKQFFFLRVMRKNGIERG
jgi:hypothetical protein